MGFDSFTSDEEEQPQDTDPSGTHVYFYEQGHDRLPEDAEVAEALAEAYENARTQPSDGSVRKWANNNWSGGLVHMLADYVNALGDMREERSLAPVLDLILGDVPAEVGAKQIFEFLKQNPEMGQELEQLISGGDDEEADD